MGWTPRAQLTRSATRASANSTEKTPVSLATLRCAMSKLFERILLSLHDLIWDRQDSKPKRALQVQLVEISRDKIRCRESSSQFSDGRQLGSRTLAGALIRSSIDCPTGTALSCAG